MCLCGGGPLESSRERHVKGAAKLHLNGSVPST